MQKNNPLTYQEWMRHKKQGKTWREFKRYKHEVLQQFPIDKKQHHEKHRRKN